MKKESSTIRVKPCKRIVTKDPATKKTNGFLLEVVSERDGFTKHIRGQIYMTTVEPGAFKGYHLHADADYYVTCIRGQVREIIYTSAKKKRIIRMGDGDFKTVFLPRGCPHAIENIGDDVAYILVYRYHAWSPEVHEQMDIARGDIAKPMIWKKIRAFLKTFPALDSVQ